VTTHTVPMTQLNATQRNTRNDPIAPIRRTTNVRLSKYYKFVSKLAAYIMHTWKQIHKVFSRSVHSKWHRHSHY